MAIQDDLSDKHAPIRAVMRRIEILERTGATTGGGSGETVVLDLGAEEPHSGTDRSLVVGTGIDLTTDITVTGLEVACQPVGGRSYRYEVWRTDGGHTLVGKMGASPTLVYEGATAQQATWVTLPAVSIPLAAGSRYAILLVWGGDPEHGIMLGFHGATALDLPGIGSSAQSSGVYSADVEPYAGQIMGIRASTSPQRVQFRMTARVGSVSPVSPAQISAVGASEGQVLEVVGGVPMWTTVELPSLVDIFENGLA